MKCPVCGEEAISRDSKTRSTKGVDYRQDFYEHDDKLCICGKVFYTVDGGTPKTVTEKFSRSKEILDVERQLVGDGPKTKEPAREPPKVKESPEDQEEPEAFVGVKQNIGFVKMDSGDCKLSRIVERNIFLELLKGKATTPPKTKGEPWVVDPAKARPILEKYYVVDDGLIPDKPRKRRGQYVDR